MLVGLTSPLPSLHHHSLAESPELVVGRQPVVAPAVDVDGDEVVGEPEQPLRDVDGEATVHGLGPGGRGGAGLH